MESTTSWKEILLLVLFGFSPFLLNLKAVRLLAVATAKREGEVGVGENIPEQVLPESFALLFIWSANFGNATNSHQDHASSCVLKFSRNAVVSASVKIFRLAIPCLQLRSKHLRRGEDDDESGDLAAPGCGDSAAMHEPRPHDGQFPVREADQACEVAHAAEGKRVLRQNLPAWRLHGDLGVRARGVLDV